MKSNIRQTFYWGKQALIRIKISAIPLFFICSVGIPALLQAQSTAGITNRPDTSYSTYSAYISTRKTHPDIKIAEELHSPAIKEKRNIVYCSIGKRKLQLDVFYPADKNK